MAGVPPIRCKRRLIPYRQTVSDRQVKNVSPVGRRGGTPAISCAVREALVLASRARCVRRLSSHLVRGARGACPRISCAVREALAPAVRARYNSARAIQRCARDSTARPVGVRSTRHIQSKPACLFLRRMTGHAMCTYVRKKPGVVPRRFWREAIRQNNHVPVYPITCWTLLRYFAGIGFS